MGDLIDRQAAIDAMCSACGNDCDKSKFVYDAPQYEQVILCPEHYALSVLPSIQSEIIHCRECKFGEVDNPCLPDQYFCHHNGCDWNLGDHYCGYAERREETNEGNH